ncbi:conjugated bile salt MFS transporter [Eubacterium multiforme]|uniref:MFS family permease n=1 Tax=Eubacterium multiforme TaxID=83339 RepID=A0ABT9UV44_9FIRM|nr:conjugated bile salt MFS transporter [Eubacterium multiforme]MDQ0150178.1 MFS family permease [Eubacterium multiforme]
METTIKKLKEHKYLVIFMCMLLQAVPFCIAQNIQPLFISYVIKGQGFSLGEFSLIFTIGSLASAICSPTIGKLYSKINVKVLFTIGCIVSGSGFLAFAFAKSIGMYYLFEAIMQIGTIAFSTLGVPLLVNAWFEPHERGKALGVVFSGGAIGNIFLQPIVANCLANLGYAHTYLVFGIVSLVVSIPVALIFIRLPKSNEKELIAKLGSEATGEVKEVATFDGLGAKATKKNKYFWIYAIGFLFIGLSISALSTQYAAFLRDGLGFDAKRIGIAGSFLAFFCLIGNVSGGFLFDKFGTFKTMLIAGILETISCIALILSPSMNNLVFLFAIGYGLNIYSYMTGPGYTVQALFGRKESSEILGIVSLLFAVGFAAGTTLFGFLVGKYGYSIGWYLTIVAVAIGYGILLYAVEKINKQNKSRDLNLNKDSKVQSTKAN